MYDITIEEHFRRLTSINRNISGLWCMTLLLYSSISGTLFVGFEPESTRQLFVRIEYEYLGEGLSIMNFTGPEQPARPLRDMSIFKE